MPYREADSLEFGRKAAKKFKKGRFTASETGARQLAETKFAYAQNREILNAAAEGTKAFEERAIKKNPRPTRKTRY